MRICVFSIVTHWHDVQGGMEIHGKLLAEGLAKRGHHVSIITTMHPDGIAKETKNGVRIYYLEETSFGSYRKGWKQESIRKFHELNKSNDFDIIWSQSYAGYPYTRKLRDRYNIPMASIIQGTVAQGLSSWWINLRANKKQFGKNIRGLLHSFFAYFFIQIPLLYSSDLVICVSHQIERETRKFYLIKDRKTSVVLNGIDCTMFSPNMPERNKIREQSGVDEGENLLLSLGKINKEKGHHITIKILKHLLAEKIAVKLMIVGEGPFLENLKKMAIGMGLEGKVIFTGYVPNEGIPCYYNAADIHLFPSFRREGLPLTVVEAMSCGKPVIAWDSGSIRSVLEHGFNGFLVSSANIPDMIAKIKMILEDKGIYNKISTNARQTALKKFDHERMVELTINSFEGIMNK